MKKKKKIFFALEELQINDLKKINYLEKLISIKKNSMKKELIQILKFN